jgi:hypothetical protein
VDVLVIRLDGSVVRNVTASQGWEASPIGAREPDLPQPWRDRRSAVGVGVDRRTHLQPEVIVGSLGIVSVTGGLDEDPTCGSW